jgi:23S rRNA (cytosine1962-C5)-methyltransferase
MPDASWFAAQIRRAWEMRGPLRGAGTTAFRWVNGEGDGIPGVVVDFYDRYAVVETYADSLGSVLDWVIDGVRACVDLRAIVLRGDGTRLLWGKRLPRDLIVAENGLRFHVDLQSGQKTGLYLDQRDNRRYLEQWCAGKRVLNCFAYTGAFTLYAVRGGARETTSVEIAPEALEAGRRNLALNGFTADEHSFSVADCFDLLPRYAEQGREFDIVILDPPSLARSKRRRQAALRAYARLNAAAMRCTAGDGLLASASCTSQVSPQAFREVLGDAAARARKRLLILHEAGHAIDHPVPAHFPEGRYLKFILGRVRDEI